MLKEIILVTQLTCPDGNKGRNLLLSNRALEFIN